MAGLLGRIEQYDIEVEEWPQYIERLQHFFTANGIVGEDNAEKRRSTFLTVIGPAPYKLLRSLLAPTRPDEKTFEQLAETLANHYSPPPSEVIQRFRFNTRTRLAGESVATYVAELRRLAEFCNYGSKLNEMLRDRLVCGINHEAIQKKLLAERELTYERAIAVAQGSEQADRNMREIKTQKTMGVTVKQEPVNRLLVGAKAPRHPRSPKKQPEDPCYRCGGTNHKPADCRFRDQLCRCCRKKGHIARVCRSKGKKTASEVKTVNGEAEVDYEEPLNAVKSPTGRVPPLRVQVLVDGCEVPMEIDTGASRSIMSESVFRSIWPKRGLQGSTIQLHTYSKGPIPVVGALRVNVECNDQTAQLTLLVVKGDGPTLLGRDWLSVIRLDWPRIYYASSSGLQALLDKHRDVFQEGLGTFRGRKARIEVESGATPRYCKARQVPFALRPKVEGELERLVAEGTLEPVTHSEWATPLVAVLKADKKSVRLCGDFKVTVNQVAKLDRYPVPRVDDLFATLSRGRLYTKLDLSHAYQQLLLDDESKKYVVINTTKGLFRYTRLPYGISSAPGIFQREMEHLFQGIPGVVVYLDDILVAGEDEQSHLRTLETVLHRLSETGLRVKQSKCLFMVPTVSFLGHRIDADGLHPLQDKVEAIEAAPTPTNVTELKSYLGLLTYYGKFLPNLATRLAPLYKLLQHDVPWEWTSEQEKAFKESKKLLASSSLLVHYDTELPLTLACDASAYGIGAVLAHRMPDGSEKPIGYASRTLNKAEKNYSQLEKEGLSLVFGIKKFYSYVFGRPFELVTDHRPLLGLLGEARSTSPQASARIRRWSVYLSMFEYTLRFRKTDAHANADALSRLPLPVEAPPPAEPTELVLLAEHLLNAPVSAEQIRKQTERDPTLAPVVQFLKQGWPCKVDKKSSLSPFFKRKEELSIFEGCILWGTRVVIPSAFREAILAELHEGHPGIVRMKGLARSYVWWPGITGDIETTVHLCSECQMSQATPAHAPLHPWHWPTRPWARLHLDYAGPVSGRMYLVLIDAHSKWVEAFCTPSATSAAVIEELRPLFACFGLPETVVTDNGTCFTSAEFKDFLATNGIRHITSAPYHPSSNGLAERAVQIVKRGLRKTTGGSVRSRLAKFLYAYRLAPQGTTGRSPAEMLLGRRPRSRLDILRPLTAERVETQQLKQKSKHDAHAHERLLQEGDSVLVRNYLQGEKWLPGTIVRQTGPVSYSVRLSDGRERRCHQDQVRKRWAEIEIPEGVDVDTPTPPPDPAEVMRPGNTTETGRSPEAPESVGDPAVDPPRTYPHRERKTVDRFEPKW